MKLTSKEMLTRETERRRDRDTLAKERARVRQSEKERQTLKATV